MHFILAAVAFAAAIGSAHAGSPQADVPHAIVSLGKPLLWLYAGMALAVCCQLLLAAPALRGLLATRCGCTAEPERVLALAATAAVACSYAAQCLAGPHGGTLPEPAGWMLAAAGTSQLAYLLGKAHRAG